jgi:hypothetical protein
VDIFISAKRKREVHQYATAVNLPDEECMASFAKIRPALNVKSGGGHKHTSGDTIKDKSGGFWQKVVPTKFDYSLLGSDFDDREITRDDILNLFRDHPELLVDNPDAEFILDELDSHEYGEDRLANRDLNSDSYRNRGTAANLDRAIEMGKRSTDWFTNVVCDHETDDVVPFTVLYNKAAPTDVYFIGFAPNISMSETMWKSLMGMNNTLKKCNYNPAHVIVTEARREIHNVNGGQTIIFPRGTSENDVMFYEELRAAILRSRQITGAQREIASHWCNGTKEFKGIRLYKNTFTQETIDAITKKIEEELSVKIKYTKTPGRPPSAWFQYSSISW